ncbi:MAG: rod shape-determining protein MreD [Lachnospiraceae bacterium]|uniref:rod shape-determining protein MreD n=1 Tax=Parablautia sp. Marseille-Q6255 TaxID=3039593 RepID=UPI0024BC9F47|nr:rod shape-determining protein MreD [Parablautia sp. Marseille-Q6255]
MRRKITMAVLILVSIILQSTVCQMIAIASIKPNLLIILTVSFGLMRGRRDGMLTGFFCGLLTDIFFESVLGFNAFIYMWVGYFSGYFYRIFYDDDIKTPLLLISVSDVAYGVVQYGFRFLLRGRIDFFYYLGRVILPEMFYTLILTILCYRILYAVNRKLSLSDKGVDNFV